METMDVKKEDLIKISICCTVIIISLSGTGLGIGAAADHIYKNNNNLLSILGGLFGFLSSLIGATYVISKLESNDHINEESSIIRMSP